MKQCTELHVTCVQGNIQRPLKYHLIIQYHESFYIIMLYKNFKCLETFLSGIGVFILVPFLYHCMKDRCSQSSFLLLGPQVIYLSLCFCWGLKIYLSNQKGTLFDWSRAHCILQIDSYAYSWVEANIVCTYNSSW